MVARWMVGIIVGGMGILALFLAARSENNANAYTVGILVALFCAVAVFYLIKRHYDAVEAGEADDPNSLSGIIRAKGPLALLGLFLPFPARNRWDNLTVAAIAGCFGAACGIMSSYTSGAEAYFGLALFLGLGALAGVAGLSALVTRDLTDQEEEGA